MSRRLKDEFLERSLARIEKALSEALARTPASLSVKGYIYNAYQAVLALHQYLRRGDDE